MFADAELPWIARTQERIAMSVKLKKIISAACTLPGWLAILFVIPMGSDGRSWLQHWIDPVEETANEVQQIPYQGFGMIGIQLVSSEHEPTTPVNSLSQPQESQARIQSIASKRDTVIRVANRPAQSAEGLTHFQFDPIGDPIREQTQIK